VARTPLDVDRLRAVLAPRWSRVDVVDQTASTNADLLADPAAVDRTALAAEHQVAGRGRFDRTWTSPPRAGLTFSVLLRPTVPVHQWGWLPLLAGLALQEAVVATSGVDAVLKWPNDLLARPGDGKLAGILAQTGDGSVVVGIGLNVDTTAAELPTDTATSLVLCGASAVDRTELLAAILGRIDARAARWVDAGGDAAAAGIDAAYRAACATLGRAVLVTLGDGSVVEGRATDVDAGGRLVVRTGDGPRTVAAGDVEHVRPA
jgi:BirA family transcriptional regulator, biotin operon repressor / biotin---[acetyl-CoA-carboxylase] ligase